MPKGTHKSLYDRAIEKVAMQADGCWYWTAARTGGYGVIGIGPRGAGTARAHRVIYEVLVGPIPDGMQLDHLCRVRHCVNPAHLEPVTQRENILRGEAWSAVNARKTCCPHGHPYDAANTYWYGDNRHCRTCKLAYDARRRANGALKGH